MSFSPSACGYFGKLPARGDFVRAGLPEDMVAPWDAWCRSLLNASRAALGEAWEGAWVEAPIWRFLLPPGACGRQAVLGVWLPSQDKIGRQFPFLLCALAPSLEGLEAGGNWLEAAQAAGLAAVVEDAPPAVIAAALQAPMAKMPVPGPGWWTQGSPLVAAARLEIPALLPPGRAGAMLRDDPLVAEALR